MQPLFSIIIPTRNSEKTIERCLNSVTNQTYLNAEILVIDGCSTDETINIIKKSAATNASISFTTEPDNGIYDAMNKAILKAKGKWLFFLGSDDALYHDHILEDVSLLLIRSPGDIVYGNVIINGSNPWRKNNEIYAGEFNLKKILKENISQQSIFYRSELFNKMGLFDIRYKVSADYDFMLKCFATNVKMIYLDLIIAIFSVGGVSSTNNDKEFEHDKGLLIARYFYDKLYKPEFINWRLYMKQLALHRYNPQSNLLNKSYYLLCYTLQKLRSIFSK